MNQSVVIKNKKAFFDYEVLETIEAGLILSGHETKAIKSGQVNLKGSYVSFHKDQIGIAKMHVSKYKPAGPMPDHDPDRWRPLLLHKKQIALLMTKNNEKGLTIIPLKVYTKGRLIKVEIGICRGKKMYNKREIIKQKDIKRETQRTLKNS